ncbi:hypothetical protein [Pantanalinema sp. GBBB05]|uniref:hypothetical protein n=1 Tax=Pantanalinema sp. GBBB05 TaxID=2604139 RepID=UPI003D818303
MKSSVPPPSVLALSLLTLAVSSTAKPAHADDAIVSFAPPATSNATPPAPPPSASPLSFTPTSPPAPSPPAPPPTIAARSTPPTDDQLFNGGSESLVARTVGAAEGTRTADGGKTSLWEHHTDPGNFVENCGTFSYQFGYGQMPPEECDVQQMAKIRRHYEETILPQAQAAGIELDLLEKLNGIDLANQAPLAVTQSGGYVDRLVAEKQKGLQGSEAILEARVMSFCNPERGDGTPPSCWDASGLRAYDDISKEASIRHDQQRRMDMIDRALAAWEQDHPQVAQQLQLPDMAQLPAGQAQVAAVPASSLAIDREKVADQIIFWDASQQVAAIE